MITAFCTVSLPIPLSILLVATSKANFSNNSAVLDSEFSLNIFARPTFLVNFINSIDSSFGNSMDTVI